jgi:N-acetylmuramate 1-kinase
MPQFVPMTLAENDIRLVALQNWAALHIPEARSWLPASADASFRRYFRVTDQTGKSVIAMDAPPPQEDCAPFVKIARLMQKAGVFAPQVLAENLPEGFLLLTDMGKQTYLDVLSDPTNIGQALPLFKDANKALIQWQLATQPNVLPAYDEPLLRKELQLFPDWYVGKHLGKTLNAKQQALWDAVSNALVARALNQNKVFVHRDYMPRNLMVSEPNPGVLDFQDATYGPIGYDVISLYRDAFISWEEEFVLDGVVRYWEAARKAQLGVPSEFGEFYKDCEWIGLQRHLKILGIFARINYRDGKPKYLADTPRFIKYARDVAKRYSLLGPLVALFDSLEIQIES